MQNSRPKAGPAGRIARLALGVCLLVIAVPVWLVAGADYNAATIGLIVGLVAFYTLLHAVLGAIPNLNRWLGAVIAVIPVFLVWFFGQGGGPLFGQGEGGTAAISFLAISFLVDFLRSDSGCEVMALPSLIVRRRIDLPCLLLCPIDHVDDAVVPPASRGG